MYTEFHRANTLGGGVVWPTAFLYPNEPAALNADYQFHWGDWLLVAPVVNASATSVDVYIPQSDNWYSYPSGIAVKQSGRVTVSAPIDVMPMFLRAGVILHVQQSALSVKELSSSPYTLVIACAPTSASGRLFTDDGESYISTQYDTTYDMACYGGLCKMTSDSTARTPAMLPRLNSVTVWGVSVCLNKAVSSVTVNGVPWSAWKQTVDILIIDTTGAGIGVHDPMVLTWG